MALIVLVTGSREWQDPTPIHEALEELLAEHKFLAIISGGQRGADNIAETWHEDDPHVHHFTDPVTPAEWRAWGKSAGVIRNRRLLTKAQDVQAATAAEIYVLGFPMPGSRGTWDMIGACKEAGLHGKVIHPREKETTNE